MSITAAIQEFAAQLATEGGGVTEIRLSARAYDRFEVELARRAALDMHEAWGDYDRPSSPWYGSRPGKPSLAVNTISGLVRIVRSPS